MTDSYEHHDECMCQDCQDWRHEQWLKRCRANNEQINCIGCPEAVCQKGQLCNQVPF